MTTAAPRIEPVSADYRVELDTFNGPLDLLLHLVKREEVDVRDIPIALVAEQFKAYLDVPQVVDVEQAGEFLVVAAQLMEIKSRLLLPRPPAAEQEADDPRQELVRQLLEYKRYKDAAVLLEAQGERQAQRLPRQAGPPPAAAAGAAVQPVELWDLVSAFGRLLRETLANETAQIVVDQTPLHVVMEQIESRLEREPRLSLAALFTPPRTRGRLVGLFLALLELARRFRIVAEQPDPHGDILFSRAPEATPEGQEAPGPA